MDLILKNSVEFSCNTKQSAMVLQNSCADFLNRKFYPKLEKLLETYSPKNIQWTFESIDITIHATMNNWEHEFLEQALYQIESYLKTRIGDIITASPDPHKIYISIEDHAFELLINYLKNSVLNANTISSDLSTIIEKIQWHEYNVLTLINLLLTDKQVLLRFIMLPLHSNKFLLFDNLFQYLASRSTASIEFKKSDYNNIVVYLKKHPNDSIVEVLLLISILNKVSNTDFIIAHLSVLKDYLKYSENNTELSYQRRAQLMRKISSNSIIHMLYKNVTNTILDQSGKSLNNKDETIANKSIDTSFTYINNAGLIILHPFLLSFFEKVKLIQDNNWINKMAQHKAVLLLQYLGTSQDIFWDNQLHLNKLLCGLSIETVINTKITITEADKIEANNLLLSVLEHWTILKNTSIEGLQNSFFMRAGKLVYNNNAFDLYVEQKGIDILLDKLPWSFSFVKSNLMKTSITTIWNY